MNSSLALPPVSVRPVPFDLLDPVNDVAYWGESIRAILSTLGQLRGSPVLLPQPMLFAEADDDLTYFDEALVPLSHYLAQRHAIHLLGSEDLAAIDDHVQTELKAVRALEVLHGAVEQHHHQMLKDIDAEELVTLRDGAESVGRFLERLRNQIALSSQIAPLTDLSEEEARNALLTSDTPVGTAHYLVEI